MKNRSLDYGAHSMSGFQVGPSLSIKKLLEEMYMSLIIKVQVYSQAAIS